MKRISTAYLAISFAAAAPAFAQTSEGPSIHYPQVAQAAGSTPLAEGEVRKIDKEAAKVTIKHGPIANLDMPAMTMVFRVKDPATLDKMKVGDKIHFIAEKVDGAFTVMRVDPAK